MSIRTIHIYALECPIEKRVKYVGRAKDLITRYKSHLSSPTSSLKEWIQNLRAKGLRPTMIELEAVEYKFAFDKEMSWIEHFQKEGSLLNRSVPNNYNGLPIKFLSDKVK